MYYVSHYRPKRSAKPPSPIKVTTPEPTGPVIYTGLLALATYIGDQDRLLDYLDDKDPQGAYDMGPGPCDLAYIKYRACFLRRIYKGLYPRLRMVCTIDDVLAWLLTCGIDQYRGLNLCTNEGEPAFISALYARNESVLAWFRPRSEIWPASYIAAEGRISVHAVRAALYLEGGKKITGKPATNPTAEATFNYLPHHAEVRERRTHGWSFADIAPMFGVRAQWLKSQHDRQVHAFVRNPSAYKTADCNHSDFYNKKHALWAKQYGDAASLQDLADTWGIDWRSAYARLRRLGLDPNYWRESAREGWLSDLQKHGSVYAAAKFWKISHQAAGYRAKKVGYKHAT